MLRSEADGSCRAHPGEERAIKPTRHLRRAFVPEPSRTGPDRTTRNPDAGHRLLHLRRQRARPRRNPRTLQTSPPDRHPPALAFGLSATPMRDQRVLDRLRHRTTRARLGTGFGPHSRSAPTTSRLRFERLRLPDAPGRVGRRTSARDIDTRPGAWHHVDSRSVMIPTTSPDPRCDRSRPTAATNRINAS